MQYKPHNNSNEYLLCNINLYEMFFTITIISQVLFFLVNGHRSVLTSEKRLTTNFPKKDTISIRKYTIQLENYLNDQLQGQNKFTTINNRIRYSMFSELSTNKLVHFGEDGWLFDISGKAKIVYENKNPYTIDELKQLTSLLQNRNNWLKKLGIKYYVVFLWKRNDFNRNQLDLLQNPNDSNEICLILIESK